MDREKPLSNWGFKLMAFFFKIRDFFQDPKNKIEKMDIGKGDKVLEYGCGSGSFTIPLAKMVGPSGKVYAADMHPLSSKKITEKAKKNKLNNIETIQTKCKTNLDDNSIDKVILIDVLHDLKNHKENLEEFHRILKLEGTLWVDDHHLNPSEIKQKITDTHLFEFVKSIDSLYKFLKIST
jgi:ubiquinone/menaquinone biosynthesis C-methylase UbiE